LSTNPASPSSQTSLTLSGNAEPGSTVRIYTAADCSGTALVGGSASDFAAGLSLTAPRDATTSFYATATDAAGNTSPCSSGVSYSEDSTPPAAPTVLTTNPTSPSNQTSLLITGQAEAGSTVRIYTTPDCSGSMLAAGSASDLAAGISVTALSDSTTSFYATATDGAGNTSPCSSGASYSEDSTPPAAPSALSTNPTSPSTPTSRRA